MHCSHKFKIGDCIKYRYTDDKYIYMVITGIVKECDDGYNMNVLKDEHNHFSGNASFRLDKNAVLIRDEEMILEVL